MDWDLDAEEERDSNEYAYPDDLPSLGLCCACGTDKGVRNVFILHVRAPVAGHGWGCLQCGLPSDGALAVLCDSCLELVQADFSVLTTACRGWPADDGRVLLSELTEPFDHDYSRHPEEVRRG